MRCHRCGQDGPESRVCPFCGTLRAAPAPEDVLVPGAVVNERYVIERKIGAGGMSSVFLARHTHLGWTVALKVLRTGRVGDPHAIVRFAREARASARIAHPNVVRVFDFGVAAEGFHYLVTEYVEGSALSDALDRRGRFDVPATAHVMAQMASALAQAHDLGIVHRDLKPGNVMLTRQGADADFVKVLDFGLAASVQPTKDMPQVTIAGQLLGSPIYMAPERWRSSDPDPRSDIYAIGVIGWELLTGSPPFAGASLVQLMLQHANEPAQPPSRTHGGDDLLDAVVLRCLEKDPGARYANATALVAALTDVLKRSSPRLHRTTYAPATQPSSARSAIPDPTVFQSDSHLDAVWDGPALCSEISRLHALRGRRLAELSQALWSGRPPDEVQSLLSGTHAIESAIELRGREVALLEDRIAEQEQRMRLVEARQRSSMIDASLTLATAVHRLPPEVMYGETLTPDAGAQLAEAERRLAEHDADRRRQLVETAREVEEHVAAISKLQRQLGPQYEALWKIIRQASKLAPEVRPLLTEYGKIDGALLAYQALLDALESVHA